MLYFYSAYTHSMEGILCVFEYYFLTLIFIIILVSSMFIIIFVFGNLFSFFNTMTIYYSFFLFFFFLIFHLFFTSSWFSFFKKYLNQLTTVTTTNQITFYKQTVVHKILKIRKYIIMRFPLTTHTYSVFFFDCYSFFIPFFYRNFYLVLYITFSFVYYIGFFLPIFFFFYPKNVFFQYLSSGLIKKKSFSFVSLNKKMQKKNKERIVSVAKNFTTFLRRLLQVFSKVLLYNKSNVFLKKFHITVFIENNFFRFLHFHNHSRYWKSLVATFLTFYTFYFLPFNPFFFFTVKVIRSSISLVFIQFHLFFISSCNTELNQIYSKSIVLFIRTFYKNKKKNNFIIY